MAANRILMAATIFIALPSSSAVADDALYAEIDAGNKAFAAALTRGDPATAVAAYTDDACVLAPSSETACGTQEILAFWIGVINSGVKNIKIGTGEVNSSGDLAYAVGTLEVTDSNDVKHLSRYVLVFKKIDGQWKLHIDMWTPS